MAFQRCRLLTLLLGTAILCACTTTYPVVGGYDEYNAVFRGTVHQDFWSGGATIEVTGVNAPLQCQVEVPPRVRAANLLCVDGTTIQARWIKTSLTTGAGEGQDQQGRRLRFAFGMTDEEAAARVRDALRQSADLPPLAVTEGRIPVSPFVLDLPLPGLEVIREAGRPAPAPVPTFGGKP